MSLMKPSRRSDAAALELFDANHKLLFWALRRKQCPERFEDDVAAVARWRLWRCCQLYDELRGIKFSTYACKSLLLIVGRLIDRQMRREERQVGWEDAFPVSPPVAPTGAYVEPDVADQIRAARRSVLPALTTRERQVVLLMAEEGLRRREVAQRLGITRARVGMLVRATRRKVEKARQAPTAPVVNNPVRPTMPTPPTPHVLRPYLQPVREPMQKTNGSNKNAPQTNDSNGPAMLTSQAVASKLSVSVRTLWRLVAAGEFPAPVRYNRKLVRWRASDVVAYFASLEARVHYAPRQVPPTMLPQDVA